MKMNKKFRKGFLFLLLGLSVWFLFHAASGSRELTVYFLDVGQGDAAFIVFPCGGNMLVDAGDSRQGNTDIAAFLRSIGIRKIDAVVLSHAHLDHAGGLADILSRFPVGVFIEPGHPHTTDIYINLLEQIMEKDIDYVNASRGDSLEGFGDAEISFLSPPEVFYGGESLLNNNSLVMLIAYKDVRFLFTGDIESCAESDLVRLYGERLSSHVLKVPHHGSGSSSTSDFVQAVSPVIAVVSAGAGNRFGHPHSSVIRRYEEAGAEVFRTDADGAVIVRTDGRGIRVGPGR